MDEQLFRLINLKLTHPALDSVFSWFTDKGIAVLGIAGVAVCVAKLIYRVRESKENSHGHAATPVPITRILLLFLFISVASDMFLKAVVDRQRPPVQLSGIRIREHEKDVEWFAVTAEPAEAKDQGTSFPSSHAAYAFGLAVFFTLLDRRLGLIFLPMAMLIAYSRVYIGVHFPSDVVAGACVGSAIGVLTFELPGLWRRIHGCIEATGIRYTKKWLHYFEGVNAEQATYLRLSFILVACITALRIWRIYLQDYMVSPVEAYYWDWSRYLDMAHLSNGVGVAAVVGLFTKALGVTDIGVRMGAVFASALVSLLVFIFSYRIFKSEKIAFWTILVLNTMPLFSAASYLMTSTPLVLLAHGLIVYGVYRATTGARVWWYLCGITLGFAIWCDIAALLSLLGMVFYLLVSTRQRHWLRMPEPYLAIALALVIASPSLIANFSVRWMSAEALLVVADGVPPLSPWNRLGGFLFTQVQAATPFYVAPFLIGLPIMWKRARREQNDALLLLFSFSAPIFVALLVICLFTFVSPGIALLAYLPASIGIIGMVCQGIERRCADRRFSPEVLCVSLTVVAAACVMLVALCYGILYYDPWIIGQQREAAHRFRGWEAMGKKMSLLYGADNREGMFMFSYHPGIAAEVGFYSPDNLIVFSPRTESQVRHYSNGLIPEGCVGKDAFFIALDKSVPREVEGAFEEFRYRGTLIIASEKFNPENCIVHVGRGFRGLQSIR